MSNPAIVLMTDPSRCSLGDVHYLLQALLEMQQMGEHATPQAFCDHPAAAKGFIEAYAHAYPKLVLQDGAIPTPDHLESLIASGQIGAFGQAPEPASFGGPVPFGSARPGEQNGLSGFPIVVLTLGSSQVLIDAIQHSPTMKDSIRLVDIVPDGADDLPVSVAEAVAMGGLDSDGAWEADGLGGQRLELDEVAGASTPDSSGLAFDDDAMDLDVVETAETPGGEASGYDDGGEQESATPEPAPLVDAPEPKVAAEPVVETAAPEEAYEASPTVEPVAELVSADTTWPDDASLVEPEESTDQSDELTSEGEGNEGDVDGGEDPSEDAAGEDSAGEHPGRGPKLDDDDVYYEPVGSLIAGSDVLYPALDQAATQGMMDELAGVMLSDTIFDPELDVQPPPAQADDLPLTLLRDDEVSTIRSSAKVVTIEDLYGSFDDESEDVFANSDTPRPEHDTDL